MPIVSDKCVEFGDPRLNRSREIPPKAVGGGIFHHGFFRDNFQSDAASDVISDVIAQQVGVHVFVKFDDSSSKRSPDIRATHFIMVDERRRTTANDGGRRS